MIPQLSVVHATQIDEPRQIAEFAEFAELAGFHRLWIGQSLGVETHQALAVAATARPGLRLGSSVALMPLWHPLTAAVTASSLAQLSGVEYVAGFGTSEPATVTKIRGTPIEGPAAYAREFLTIMRQILENGQADLDGKHFTCHQGLGAPLTGDVRLCLGVLRPAMARAAGALADAAVTWLCPRPYIQRVVRPELEQAADRAGRPCPHVAAVVHVALTGEAERATRMAERAVQAHVRRPHYVDMLRRAGFDVDPGDPAATARQLVETGGFVYGTPDEVVDSLTQFGDARVDEVVLNALGAGATRGPAAAMLTLRRITDAWYARHAVPAPRRQMPAASAGA
jgi:alkanesulfonate monooxygenase SsuD/methylene tetrahydromethanopterin reductase-like flavin-dependent oxidoreductase (luciferase family)